MRWKDEIGITKICCRSIQCNCKWRCSNIKLPPKKSCLYMYSMEIARQTTLRPGRGFLYVTWFGFCVSPLFRSQFTHTTIPISCWEVASIKTRLHLVRGRQDLLGTGLLLKPPFFQHSLSFSMCRQALVFICWPQQVLFHKVGRICSLPRGVSHSRTCFWEAFLGTVSHWEFESMIPEDRCLWLDGRLFTLIPCFHWLCLAPFRDNLGIYNDPYQDNII